MPNGRVPGIECIGHNEGLKRHRFPDVSCSTLRPRISPSTWSQCVYLMKQTGANRGWCSFRASPRVRYPCGTHAVPNHCVSPGDLEGVSDSKLCDCVLQLVRDGICRSAQGDPGKVTHEHLLRLAPFSIRACNAVEGISGGGAQRNKSSLYRANAECPRTGKLRCSLQPCHRASPNLLALVCPMQRDSKFQLVCCMPHVSVRCTQCRYDGMSCTGLHEAALIRLDTDTKIRSPDAPSTVYCVSSYTNATAHKKDATQHGPQSVGPPTNKMQTNTRRFVELRIEAVCLVVKCASCAFFERG